MKKILHIQKAKGISGSEKHLVDLLSGLVSHDLAKNLESHFLILEEPHLPQDELAQKLADVGVVVHRERIHHHFDGRLIFKLCRFFKKEKFTLIHTHLIHADIHAGFAARLLGIPQVSTKHGWDIYEKMSWLQQALLRLASRKTRAFIAISHALVPFLCRHEKISENKITVIHYGLDPDFKKISKKPSPPDGPLKLLYLGRLVPEKGLRELLMALKNVQSHSLDFHLSLAGSGPFEKDLQSIVEKEKIVNVSFLGFCRDIDALLANHHALILPSYGEGFGLVCLEAMAARRPILATNVTALPEIVIDGETGFLFAPRSTAAITEVLSRVDSEQNRLPIMGEAGYHRLLKYFSQGRMIEATLEFYGKLIFSCV